MRYFALASDYDATLAAHGQIGDTAVAALRRLRAEGRKVILVTGRLVADLLQVCPDVELFDRVVAENGAVIYSPANRTTRALCSSPPEGFIDELRSRNVAPLSVGDVLVATVQPHDVEVLRTIEDLGLELQIIFNKGAVMVLPSGVNKGTGLRAALDEMGLSPRNVVGIGDAENDHAFLQLCECSAAVANALPSLKERADVLTRESNGSGVAELIDAILRDELSSVQPERTRRTIPLGTGAAGGPVEFPAHGANLLFTGSSKGATRTTTAAVLDQMIQHDYQFCLIDSDGDYSPFDGVVVLGSTQRAPDTSEMIQAFAAPRPSIVVNLIAVPIGERADFCARLMPALQELRTNFGRPHWLIFDRADHLLPSNPSASIAEEALENSIFVTTEPDRLCGAVLNLVDVIVATGEPASTIEKFCKRTGEPVPSFDHVPHSNEDAVLWFRRKERMAQPFRPESSTVRRP
jgi:phosphoglycolate phosphatase (TIGR01487 family)